MLLGIFLICGCVVKGRGNGHSGQGKSLQLKIDGTRMQFGGISFLLGLLDPIFDGLFACQTFVASNPHTWSKNNCISSISSLLSHLTWSC